MTPLPSAPPAPGSRSTLKTNVDKAADLEADARVAAHSSWEGLAADGYRAFVGKVVSATDEHVGRMDRAATACTDYATHLDGVQQHMGRLRGRAVAGGLTVHGTVIEEPPSVPASVVVPDSPEALAREKAIEKVTLYNTLSEEATTVWSTHTDWIGAHLPMDVSNAQETTAVDGIVDAVSGQFPNFAGGAGAGLTSLALLKQADSLSDQAREFRRRSRVAGDPRVRGQADTPFGRAKVDDLIAGSRRLGRLGRILGGPAGIAIDIGFGIKDGVETGDWTRAALTTGASIAAGAVVVALAPVAAPAIAVVLVAGAAAAVASWGVGEIYDHWDDITDFAGDRVDDVKDFAGDVADKAGDAWDAVTPW